LVLSFPGRHVELDALDTFILKRIIMAHFEFEWNLRLNNSKTTVLIFLGASLANIVVEKLNYYCY